MKAVPILCSISRHWGRDLSEAMAWGASEDMSSETHTAVLAGVLQRAEGAGFSIDRFHAAGMKTLETFWRVSKCDRTLCCILVIVISFELDKTHGP